MKAIADTDQAATICKNPHFVTWRSGPALSAKYEYSWGLDRRGGLELAAVLGPVTC